MIEGVRKSSELISLLPAAPTSTVYIKKDRPFRDELYIIRRYVFYRGLTHCDKCLLFAWSAQRIAVVAYKNTDQIESTNARGIDGHLLPSSFEQ